MRHQLLCPTKIFQLAVLQLYALRQQKAPVLCSPLGVEDERSVTSTRQGPSELPEPKAAWCRGLYTPSHFMIKVKWKVRLSYEPLIMEKGWLRIFNQNFFSPQMKIGFLTIPKFTKERIPLISCRNIEPSQSYWIVTHRCYFLFR